MNNITTLGDGNTSVCPLALSLVFIQGAGPLPSQGIGHIVSIAEEDEYVTEFSVCLQLRITVVSATCLLLTW